MNPPDSVTLLERDLELSELGEALNQAQQGRGRIVVIEAPAGLGKTSLLRAACRVAEEAGVACLRARASELERDFAYGCMRQLLEPVVAKASGRRESSLFEGAAALSKPLFDTDGPSAGARAARQRLFHASWALLAPQQHHR